MPLKPAEWRALAAEVLGSDDGWAHQGEVFYRRDVEWVLRGFQPERLRGGEVRVWHLRVPLCPPGEKWEARLSHIVEIPLADHSFEDVEFNRIFARFDIGPRINPWKEFSVDDHEGIKLAISHAVNSPTTETMVLARCAAAPADPPDLMSACAQLILGDISKATTTLTALTEITEFRWEWQEVQRDLAVELRDVVTNDSVPAGIELIRSWADQTLQNYHIKRS
jgi:hypothetical protein